MIATEQVTVGDGRRVAVVAQQVVAGVVVGQGEPQRELLLDPDVQVGLAGIGDGLDVDPHPPERVGVGPVDRLVELGEADDLAPLHLQRIPEQGVAEPAVALEFDLPELAAHHGHPDDALGNVLRRNDHLGHGQVALAEEPGGDLDDAHEQLVRDRLALPGGEAAPQFRDVAADQGAGQHDVALRRIGLQRLSGLKGLCEEQLAENDPRRGRGGGGGGSGGRRGSLGGARHPGRQQGGQQAEREAEGGHLQAGRRPAAAGDVQGQTVRQAHGRPVRRTNGRRGEGNGIWAAHFREGRARSLRVACAEITGP